MAAYTLRGAGCCIHKHSVHAVLVTLLCERRAAGRNTTTDGGDGDGGESKWGRERGNVFEIEELEQIKGVPAGYDEVDVRTGEVLGKKKGNHGYYDRLRIPIIENTAKEEDLRDTLEGAIKEWPDAAAVLVRRHGM